MRQAVKKAVRIVITACWCIDEQQAAWRQPVAWKAAMCEGGANCVYARRWKRIVLRGGVYRARWLRVARKRRRREEEEYDRSRCCVSSGFNTNMLLLVWW